ncbi:ExbD/TolR family protein [Aquabacterium sp.]|uniref:ExbD/TolR family protein n=1 Tax=Aquabacterium sp. TaxID=1872578 RepID=UPI0037836C7A
MAAVVSRGRRRRAMGEINMVPFIDVMLVLLIIFMVSAPLITTGMVELPSVGKAAQKPEKVIEIVVGTDERFKLRVNGGDPQPVNFNQLAARVKQLQDGNAQVPVVISADKAVKYEQVVKAMDTLQRNGVQRVGLAVRQGG